MIRKTPVTAAQWALFAMRPLVGQLFRGCVLFVSGRALGIQWKGLKLVIWSPLLQSEKSCLWPTWSIICSRALPNNPFHCNSSSSWWSSSQFSSDMTVVWIAVGWWVFTGRSSCLAEWAGSCTSHAQPTWQTAAVTRTNERDGFSTFKTRHSVIEIKTHFSSALPSSP